MEEKKERREDNAVRVLILCAVAANFLLFTVKLYVGLASMSLCIYSDAINNMFDTLSCLLAFAGVLIMKKPGNKAYPDGYGRAEDVAGFVMSVIVGLTGAYFVYLALERFMYPRPVNFLVNHAVLLGCTILVKALLGVISVRECKKHDSVILRTVYMDSFADCGVTAMTLISFILTNYSGLRIDAIFGFVISIIIIVNAVKLIRESLAGLMGKNDPATAEKIENALTDAGAQVKELRIFRTGESLTAAVMLDASDGAEEAVRKAEEETGAVIYVRK